VVFGGGNPVGLLADDGTVYMIRNIAQDTNSAGGDTQLSLAAHTVTADGILYARDGQNYIVVNEVVADLGIQNATHEDYGPVPPFSFPEPE